MTAVTGSGSGPAGGFTWVQYDSSGMRDGMKVQGAASTKARRSTGIRAGRGNRRRKGSVQARDGSEASRRNIAELQALQNLRLIYASARWHDAQVRRSVAISGSQLWALAEIARRDGMGVNALAERMALHQTTASNLSNALVKEGLIRRVRDGSDRRFVHLHVTSDGRRILLQSPGPHPGLLVDALRKIDSQHLGRLRRDLAALIRLMRRTTLRAAGRTLLGE